jgi:hypothetical protein
MFITNEHWEVLQPVLEVPRKEGAGRLGAMTVAIIDDNEQAAQIVCYAVEDAGFTPWMFTGPAQSVDATVTKIKANAQAAICDHRLRPLGLANFDGAELAARLVSERLVEIRIKAHDGNAVISVLDNGPGIRGIGLDEIWLPGRTTSLEGTGFGLTIVRDSVVDLRGSRAVLANGELGGAEFTITLPLTQ